MLKRRVIVLGSTGSIGCQALAVMAVRPQDFEVVGLAAGGSQIELLADQAVASGARVLAVPTAEAGEQLAASLGRRHHQAEIIAGPAAAAQLAGEPADVVLNGITGFAGLEPTLAVLTAGTRLALANKESLVVGGPLVTKLAAAGQITPVDSEHSAFAQALRGGRSEEVRRLILTASGGPFRGWSRDQLERVTPDQALAHPTWAMGRVVTINSASLVNKGLELIEAALLFGIDFDDITVTVHPQSIVHSMVEFWDGSTLAQASPPDMSLPIALGLTWPDRLADAARPCDWTKASQWTFEPVDDQVFPAVELARRVGKLGGTAPAVFNAANEECVDAFCAGKLGFLGITETIATVIDRHLAQAQPADVTQADVTAAPADEAAGSAGRSAGSGFVADDDLSIDVVHQADAWARAEANRVIQPLEPVI